jgi:hypothetical protein
VGWKAHSGRQRHTETGLSRRAQMLLPLEAASLPSRRLRCIAVLSQDLLVLQQDRTYRLAGTTCRALLELGSKVIIPSWKMSVCGESND